MRDTDYVSKKMPHRTALDNARLPCFTVMDWREHGVEAAHSSQDNGGYCGLPKLNLLGDVISRWQERGFYNFQEVSKNFY